MLIILWEPASILSQINPIHIFIACFSKLYFNNYPSTYTRISLVVACYRREKHIYYIYLLNLQLLEFQSMIFVEEKILCFVIGMLSEVIMKNCQPSGSVINADLPRLHSLYECWDFVPMSSPHLGFVSVW